MIFEEEVISFAIDVNSLKFISYPLNLHFLEIHQKSLSVHDISISSFSIFIMLCSRLLSLSKRSSWFT